MLRKLAGDDCTINIRLHRFISSVNGRHTTQEQWRISIETADRIEVISEPTATLDRCVHQVARAIVKERIARTTSRRRNNVATNRR